MRPTRTSARTAAITVAVGTLVTGTLLVAPATQAASPAARPASATALAVIRALDTSARIPGTAWAVDPKTAQVVVSLDQTVTGAKLGKLTAVLSRFGSAVRTERVTGTLTPKTAGGDPVYGGQYRCTIGFNVRDSSNVYYFLIAGHCGNLTSTWYANSAHTTVLGTTVGSSFPGNDYAIVKYAAGVSHPGTVNLYNGTSRDITTAANAYVGESVCRSGATTGVHCGTVLAVNATVNYAGAPSPA